MDPLRGSQCSFLSLHNLKKLISEIFLAILQANSGREIWPTSPGSLFWGLTIAWEAVDPGNCPKMDKSRKVVKRGCKRSFGPREQEASCSGAQWGCTGAKECLGGAKDSWETFAPWAHQKSQRHLLHPPLTTFGDFPFLGNFPRPQHPKTTESTLGRCRNSRYCDKKHCGECSEMLVLVDVSDIFYFFCSGAEEREEAFEEVAGGVVGFN